MMENWGNQNEECGESYLDVLTDGALLPLIPGVDVELDRVLGDVLKDLHQAAEDLGLQLTDEAAGQQARVAPPRSIAQVLGFGF